MNALPHTRDQIAALIPHQGQMCLLEQVITADDGRIECRTRTHQRSDNPLRVAGKLSALHLCEYGAQATAVHGALLARDSGERAPPGWLVALREVQLKLNHLEDLPQTLEQPLTVCAQLQHRSDTGCAYEFQVLSAQQLLASGKVTVMNWAPQGSH
jgi:predicted hotdog family 3-hydroxylacyl-ACP dehydratase